MFQRKNFENRLRFDRNIMVMNLVCTFFGPPSRSGGRHYVFGLFIRVCVRACVRLCPVEDFFHRLAVNVYFILSIFLSFLPRDAMHPQYQPWACVRVCVCLSVCLSVTSRCSTKTTKRRITQTTPHDTPATLVFWCQRSPRNSTGVTPYGGAKCWWGGSKSATFD